MENDAEIGASIFFSIRVERDKMNSEQENKLINEFFKLKTKYLHLESENQLLVDKIISLNEKVQYKENLRSKLIKMCSEKISYKNDTIESLKNENQHLQSIVNNQNEQIMEQNKTIERLKNTPTIQTTIVKHPCFEQNKVKTKKEKKSQVRFPHLNLTIRKTNLKESPNSINGNRQRRKLYISDDAIVDLSN